MKTSQLTGIHHINFLFADLDAAVTRFEALGLGPFEYEDLATRGVRTARAPIGDAWLVLVSPTGDDGAPALHLREHGEGFFLLSFGVDDLDRAIEILEAAGDVAIGPRRDGIAGWRVADVAPDAADGILLQLAEDA